MEHNQKEIESQIAINKRKIDEGLEKLKEIREKLEAENAKAKEKYSKYLD